MAPLYPALLAPPLWLGIPRIAVVVIWCTAFLVYIKQRSIWAGIVALGFHLAVAACVKVDNQFFEVLWSHLTDPDTYFGA